MHVAALSEYIVLGQNFKVMNRLKALIRLFIDRSITVSNCTALVTACVNNKK